MTEREPGTRPAPRSNDNPRSSVNGTEFAPKDSLRPAGRNSRFLCRAQPPQPSEPILIPKLRIQLADFPYLHYSIDQRLLTLETCCGYGYELMRGRRKLHQDFQGPTTNTWTQRELLRSSPNTKTHSLHEGLPGTRWLMQKRQLSPVFWRTSPGQFALPRRDTRGARTVPQSGSGIRTRFPFGKIFGFSS